MISNVLHPKVRSHGQAAALEYPALTIDLGSTYTKVAVIELAKPRLMARVQAVTTADRDITEGLMNALAKLPEDWGRRAAEFPVRLACSSARGGLRVVAIGLVPELTAEAARRAALGAGARVLKAYSHHLTLAELGEIVRMEPDILLLCGGTDGGNQDVVLHNAKMLAHSSLRAPIVYAGNKHAADEARALLEARGKEIFVTENVMPALGELNVEPARQTIREVFMRKIVDGKGLRNVEAFVQCVAMPTPEAVMRAAKLLAKGTKSRDGLGELMVVDVGGATTDVHSIATGEPTMRTVVQRGLPEPYAKRTVEGDLGLRVSAAALLESVGERHLAREVGLPDANVAEIVSRLPRDIGWVAHDTKEWALDEGMAHAAVRISVERHAGYLKEMHLPAGYCYIQIGKDLTNVPHLIGTGGVFAYGQHPFRVLRGGLYDPQNPLSLKPKAPRLWIDKPYILWAVGLLSEVNPDAAFDLGIASLQAEEGT
ncbi:MAG: methylaspartate mutase accessory protein GlmL [Anaerolineales bacterium]